MKKILLSMVMVLILASPVMAGTPTIINGVGRNLETVNVDGNLCLPLRTMAEVLGFDVQWDGTFVRINSVKRPVITGDDKFKAMITQALDLLQAKDPVDYEMVCQNTKEIIVTPGNIDTEWGEAYAVNLGASKIRLSPKLMEQSHSYVASVIVHESIHGCNEKHFLFDRKLDENMAYFHQIATMQILGISQQEIESVELTRQRIIK